MIVWTGAWDAVVLAGGGARRLGGMDKPALVVGGRALLDTALAASVGARHRVVVGSRRPVGAPVFWAMETPPGSGPLAALGAGLAALPAGSDVVVALAADLPAIDEAVVARLLEATLRTPDVDGAAVFDAEGRAQPLLAAYRRPALERAVDAVGDLRNRPVKLILQHLILAQVFDDVAASDIDTPADLARWTRVHGREPMVDEWVRRLCEALDVPVDDVDITAVLDLARDAAHAVDRPAAPITTYIAGYAAAKRGGGTKAVADVTSVAAELARDWDPSLGD